MKNENSGRDLVKAAMGKAAIKGTLAGLKHNDIQTVINGMRSQISQALPSHITADRIIQMAVTLISRNPNIAECTAESLIGSLMQASILGFEPVQALGLCYFVPRKNKKNINGREERVWEVEFQIGYKGFIRLAQNSGEIKTIYSVVVREGDDYKVTQGLFQELHHIPHKDSTGNEKIIAVYAVAHYLNGGYNFVPLTKNEIERYRLMSPAQQKYGLSGVWKDHYEAMAKKTAIRRLSDYLPKSITIQKAVISDGAIINGKSFTNNQNGIDLDALDYSNEEIEVVDAETREEPISDEHKQFFDEMDGKTESQA